MSLKCQNCGAENVDHAKYCCECGKGMGFYCRKCGSYNPNGKFCISCGTKNDPVNWDEASTRRSDYSEENVYKDESGTYTADRLVFLEGNYNTKKIEIRQGTRIICNGALRSYQIAEDEYKEAIVEELIIPNSVTKIGEKAFSFCSSLRSIVIPDSVRQIEYEAFRGCSSLHSIFISDSVTKIGEGAFSSCESLQSIVVSEGNTIYDSRNNCNAIIEKKSNTLVAGCSHTVIPNSVTHIGWYAFSGCSSLRSIVIPDTITHIGWDAFRGCKSLPRQSDGLLIINDWLIDVPKNIEKITIPDIVKHIGLNAFNDYSSLQSIVIPDSVTQIDSETFCDCSSLQSIVIPNSVTHIGWNAFRGCKSLPRQSDGLLIINDWLIDVPKNIKKITIPNLVKHIGDNSFSGCSSLRSILIPNSVTHIGEKAFVDCISLQAIVIPDSVTQIGKSAFNGCSSLQAIVVSEGNTKYDSRNNCNAIIETESDTLLAGCSQTVIPDSVTHIGDSAFRGCSSLQAIVIPDSVTQIGDFAFNQCSSLQSIVIPNTVTFIGYGAFVDCSSLQSIVVSEGNTKYDSRNDCNAIIETENNTLVVGCNQTVIPNSVTHIGLFAFCGCNSPNPIIIPDSVTQIGMSSFSSFHGLPSIIIPKGSKEKFQKLLPGYRHLLKEE